MVHGEPLVPLLLQQQQKITQVNRDRDVHCFMVLLYKLYLLLLYIREILWITLIIYNIVPGSDERKIYKSISVGADCIVYDLEDSVSLNKKGTARHMVIDALEVSHCFFFCFILFNHAILYFVESGIIIIIIIIT